MEIIYNKEFKADLSLDDKQSVKQILHRSEYYLLEENTLAQAAVEYFQKVSDLYKLAPEQLKNMHQQVSFLEPREQGIEYRQFEEKTMFDSTTFGYYQTIQNVPIWRTGMAVTIKNNPNRAILSTNNSQDEVSLKLPSEKSIERWRNILLHQTSQHRTEGFAVIKDENVAKGEFIHDLLGTKPSGGATKKSVNYNIEMPRLIRGRFFAYKYDSKRRFTDYIDPIDKRDKNIAFIEEAHPSISLPTLSDKIKNGTFYLVAEITFSYYTPQFGNVNWLALVEVETNAILYLRALRDNVSGKVIVTDPARTASTAVTSNNNTILNPLRVDQTLLNLNAPVGGVQSLKGSFASVANYELPNVDPPTESSGTNFNYNVRTNNFAAVNTYFHVDRFFRMMEDLGFTISTYFPNTTFPIHVDHRGRYGTTNGIEINAHCDGNGSGGIGIAGFCLDDLSDTTNPLGIALQYDVVIHELGGHGVLYEHVGSANFPFSHSAGDSLAAILNDPDSLAEDRFLTFPWTVVTRRHDRSVTSGWAWGGTNDVGGYSSEQILSTSHFRIYRSIGGDHSDLGRRQFAARVTAYLILRTIFNLTLGAPPANALAWCNAMMATDLLNWTSEGIFGGAYNKVIRWAFEKQGLFQAPGTPTPISAEGQPPAVDLYINDGRDGEYQFQEVHWENQSIWNQRNTSDPAVHAEPIIGATNYAYVKVKNRGTVNANNATVRAYHCLPGAGLRWPNDFTEMSPIGGINLPTTTIQANDGNEIVFGPFSWVPNTNAYGHDCIIMIVSHAQDPSNVDNFTIGESVEEWRLVPNDNNVGQRNVYPVAGGGGIEGLLKSLDRKVFFAGNPFRKRVTIDLKVQLPRILAKTGLQMKFKNISNNQFTLKSGEKREIEIQLIPGNNFTKKQIVEAGEKEIRVLIYANNTLMGGMTYQLDPNISEPFNIPGGQPNIDCRENAQELLKCLKIGNKKVKKVCVKKVTLDVELDNDCDC